MSCSAECKPNHRVVCAPTAAMPVAAAPTAAVLLAASPMCSKHGQSRRTHDNVPSHVVYMWIIGNKLALSIETGPMIRDKKDGVPVAGSNACNELAAPVWHA